jgi:uncharacterized protein
VAHLRGTALSFYSVQDGAVSLRLQVQPRARRPGILGVAQGADGPRLKIAVTAAPEDGRATEAVRDTLARALDLPKSALTLLQGATSRGKIFRAEGNTARICALLGTLLESFA